MLGYQIYSPENNTVNKANVIRVMFCSYEDYIRTVCLIKIKTLILSLCRDIFNNVYINVNTFIVFSSEAL